MVNSFSAYEFKSIKGLQMDALLFKNSAHFLSLKKKTADFKKACILTTYHFQAVKNLPKSVHSIGT